MRNVERSCFYHFMQSVGLISVIRVLRGMKFPKVTGENEMDHQPIGSRETTTNRNHQSWSPTDRRNHDQDATTIGAAMIPRDTLLPENPCRFENCKVFCRLGLF